MTQNARSKTFRNLPASTRVERVRWLLLAAVSGAGAAASCGGQSVQNEAVDDARAGDTTTGGQAGSVNAGGRGGYAGRGGFAGWDAPGTGGTVALAGRAGSAGSAGRGGDAGSAGVAGDAGDGGWGGIGGSAGSSGTAGSASRPCDPVGTYGPGVVLCEGDFAHRTAPQDCALPPRDTGAGGAGGEGGEAGGGGIGGWDENGNLIDCLHDDDCTQLPNGYCRVDDIFGGTYCKYACEDDASCGEGALCACGDASLDSLGQCYSAECRSDADCEPGRLCISPLEQGSCEGYPPTSFHCQSPADECSGNDECEEEQCDFIEGRFRCTGILQCGRPFLVGGHARVAELALGEGWTQAHTTEPAVLALSRADAQTVAEHFLESALMEHASIAAFARFTLELLALGAPAELVQEAGIAIADETRHARVCFDLAARYGAAGLTPGPLALDGAFGSIDLLGVVDRAVLEGCFGETGAALEAGWAAEAAADPVVREALSAIAEDESRHAALAFRFVAWAAERDRRVLPLVEQRLREALAPGQLVPDSTASGPSAPHSALACHGVLAPETRARARRTALVELVAPAVSVLVARHRLQNHAEKVTSSC